MRSNVLHSIPNFKDFPPSSGVLVTFLLLSRNLHRNMTIWADPSGLAI